MSIHINDMAIVLTAAIETALVKEFYFNRGTPSFFNIRETIANVLESYMDELFVSTRDSPEMLNQLSPKQYEDWTNYVLKKQATVLVDSIISSPDHFHKFEYKDDFDRLRRIQRSIIVIKTEMLRRKSQEIRDTRVVQMKQSYPSPDTCGTKEGE